MQVCPALLQAAPEGCVRGGLEVGVLVHQQGVLAAGLDDHRRQRLGAGRHHPLAGGGGPGEGDLVDARAAQRRTGLAEAGDHLEHRPVRRPREGAGQPLADAGVSSLGLNTTALPAASA